MKENKKKWYLFLMCLLITVWMSGQLIYAEAFSDGIEVETTAADEEIINEEIINEEITNVEVTDVEIANVEVTDEVIVNEEVLEEVFFSGEGIFTEAAENTENVKLMNEREETLYIGWISGFGYEILADYNGAEKYLKLNSITSSDSKVIEGYKHESLGWQFKCVGEGEAVLTFETEDDDGTIRKFDIKKSVVKERYVFNFYVEQDVFLYGDQPLTYSVWCDSQDGTRFFDKSEFSVRFWSEDPTGLKATEDGMLTGMGREGDFIIWGEAVIPQENGEPIVLTNNASIAVVESYYLIDKAGDTYYVGPGDEVSWYDFGSVLRFVSADNPKGKLLETTRKITKMDLCEYIEYDETEEVFHVKEKLNADEADGQKITVYYEMIFEEDDGGTRVDELSASLEICVHDAYVLDDHAADGYMIYTCDKCYSKWEEKVYKIKYVLNGGTLDEQAPKYFTRLSDKIGVLHWPASKKGYEFQGWYSDKALTKLKSYISAGTKKNVTLYAKWKVKKFSINYELNGGTNHDSNPSKYTIESDTITLKSPSRKGYKFKGWYTDKEFKNKITSIKEGSTGKKTLYAKWSKRDYTLTYELNGGTNHKDNRDTYTITTSTFKLEKPTRTGYTFKGWYRDKDFKEKITQIEKGSTKNYTLYAKWSANTYTINYYKNGGTGTMKASSATYGKNKTLRTNTFTRKGYIFTGWNTKRDGSGKSYTDAQKVKNLTSKANGSKSLFAQWKPIEYKIRYYGNGADGSMKASVATYDKNKTLRTNTFSRKGYIYTGWNTKKDGSGKSYKDKQKVKNLTSADGDTVRLYAQWKKISEIEATNCDVDDIVTYFKEVVLDVEYSSGSGDFTLVQKWTEPIYYRVSGYATSKDKEVLNNMIKQLNEIDGFPGMYPENDQHWANMFISFYNYDDFYTYMGPVVNYESSDGAVQYWYDTYENYIYEATIGYRTDIGQYVRNSVILEEIYNGLGITDTWLREDSIAYGGYSEPQQLSDIDWLILELLYHPDIKCGMNAQQCEKVIRNIFS